MTQFGGVLLLLAVAGRIFNGITLLALAHLFFFAGPWFYVKNPAVVDGYWKSFSDFKHSLEAKLRSKKK